MRVGRERGRVRLGQERELRYCCDGMIYQDVAVSEKKPELSWNQEKKRRGEAECR